jgi:hypothetical protein
MAPIDLIELRFTGGGPMDGHELVAQAPAGEWFDVDDGRYQLWGYFKTHTPTDPPIATYASIPNPTDTPPG